MDDEIERELDGSVSGLDDPLLLSEGLWEVNLYFGIVYDSQNADGIEVWCAKYSESDYELTVAP